MLLNKAKNQENGEVIAAMFSIVFVAIFILVNFAFGFIWPLYVLAAGLLFFLTVIYPRSGLYSLVFLIIIFERFFTLFSPVIGRVEYKIYFPDLIIAGMFLNAIIAVLKNRHTIILKPKKETVVLLGFMALNVIYYFVSVYVFDSDAYLSFSSLKNYAFYSLLYFLVFWSIETEEQLKRLLKFFFAGTICIIGFIAFGIFNGEGLWTQYTPLSTEGVRILAFTHGLYLSLALIPILLFLAFGHNPKLKKVLLFLALIFSIGILGTMMRHIWVALGLAFGLIYVLLQRKEKTSMAKTLWNICWPALLVVLITFQMAIMFPQSQLGRSMEKIRSAVWERSISVLHANEDDSFAWRTVVWESAWNKYRENMLFGIGTGQKVAIEIADFHDVVEIRNMHNSYLTILVQFGIAGILLVLYFIYLHLKKLVKSGIRNDFYGLAFLSVLVFYLVAFIFQPYLETNLLAMFFWINLGLIRVINDKRNENS